MIENSKRINPFFRYSGLVGAQRCCARRLLLAWGFSPRDS
jgi:hypothetical protein